MTDGSTQGRASEQAPGHLVASWAQHQLALEILRDVETGCSAAGIPILAVKGVVTARTLYDDVSQRPIADVDVRIRRCDFWRWRALAGRAGWRCWNAAWAYRSRSYALRGLSLDVESDVGPPGLCSLTVEEMLSRSTELRLSDAVRVRAPEIHDHAVLLAVNAFKDWFVLGNAHSRLDLDRIVRQGTFRAELFVERVVRARVATIAWLAASWTEATYQNEVWRFIRESIEARASVDRLYARIHPWLAASELPHAILSPLFMVLGTDGALRRAAAVGTTAAWLGERWARGRTRMRAAG